MKRTRKALLTEIRYKLQLQTKANKGEEEPLDFLEPGSGAE